MCPVLRRRESVAGAQHPQPVEAGGSRGGVGVVIGSLLWIGGIVGETPRPSCPSRGAFRQGAGVAGHQGVPFGSRGRPMVNTAPSPGPGEVAVSVPP